VVVRQLLLISELPGCLCLYSETVHPILLAQNKYQYNDLIIEVFDDSSYKVGSVDNTIKYNKHFFGEGGQEYPVSKHGIRLFKNENEINNCIVIGSGGATGVYENSSLIDDSQLLICCCDTVFCLLLPDLELNWSLQADQTICFQIFKFQDDYLTHGELQIARLGKDGKIKWVFGGADIFVSTEGKDEFKLEQDHIMLTDFCNTKYKIDFEGNLIWKG
jgi:hypothetical protein